MGIYVKRSNLKGIDHQNRVVKFDADVRHGKITGSRLLATLGRDKYMTEFKAACLIARVCFDDTQTKETKAGEAIEPIIRGYLRENADTVLRDALKVDGKLDVEEPLSKEVCFYDHFHKEKVFGGMVDGYVDLNRERYAILEIKTCGNRSTWYDEQGNVTIPENYNFQASLYAELSGLERIVFAVGFLEEKDYVHPELFVPTKDNTLIWAVDKKDISQEMEQAREWYAKYIESGKTPAWSEKDEQLVEILATSDTIDNMPNEARRLFKKYIRMMDSDEVSDLEYNLKEIMSERAADGVKTVVYKVDGVTFSLSMENYRLTVTPDSIQS